MKQGLSRLGWSLPLIVMSLLVLLSIFSLFWTGSGDSDSVLTHLSSVLLPDLIQNTLILLLGVGSLSLMLGVSLAWFVSMVEFPGRKILSWMLLLPLALPAYVMAFVYVGLFDFTGPIQTALREWTGSSLAWFPNIRSTGGVILVMSLSLYPYIYLIAKNAFETLGARAVETGRSLGVRPFKLFFKVALPLARPWILAGLTLVGMETLADFGTVSIFNYDTFTTAIYQAWIGFFSLPAAARLGSILILFAFVFLLLEQQVSRKKRYFSVGSHKTKVTPFTLSPLKRYSVMGFSWGIAGMAFILPTVNLVIWSVEGIGHELNMQYLNYVSNSLLLGFMAAALTSGIALCVVYSRRLYPSSLKMILSRVSLLGYAIPGSVLAVGVFILLSQMSVWLAGSVCAILVGYLIRFFSLSCRSIESADMRISPRLDQAAQSLGSTGLRMLRKIHFPLLKGGIFTGAMLVFVDVMKEMPMTLMTRPYGWDTLAVRIYEMTSEGEWQRAALPAVVLLIIGIIPLILMVRRTEQA